MALNGSLTSLIRSEADLQVICRKYDIIRLSLFGSALHGNLKEDSDIDLLVEFAPDHTPGFFTLVRIEEVLSPIFHGRKVDLRTPMDLSRYFRDEVISESKVLYSEA